MFAPTLNVVLPPWVTFFVLPPVPLLTTNVTSYDNCIGVIVHVVACVILLTVTILPLKLACAPPSQFTAALLKVYPVLALTLNVVLPSYSTSCGVLLTVTPSPLNVTLYLSLGSVTIHFPLLVTLLIVNVSLFILHPSPLTVAFVSVYPIFGVIVAEALSPCSTILFIALLLPFITSISTVYVFLSKLTIQLWFCLISFTFIILLFIVVFATGSHVTLIDSILYPSFGVTSNSLFSYFIASILSGLILPVSELIVIIYFILGSAVPSIIARFPSNIFPMSSDWSTVSEL